MSDATIKALVDRLEAVAARLEKVEGTIANAGSCSGGAAAAPAAASSGEAGAAFVSEYDALISQHIDPLVAVGKKLDATLGKQLDALKALAGAQRELLNTASRSKKPADLSKFLAPTQAHVAAITQLRDDNRPSKFFNNLSAISEGVPAFGWVAVEPTPGPFVAEGKSSAEFYTNRLLKDFRGKDKDQEAFVAHWIEFLKALQAYVKTYHTTGLAWNARGSDAAAPAGPAGAPSAGAPPPPPPAGGLSAAEIAKISGAGKSAGSDDAESRANLFASINAGNVTSGLKKVDKAQMTHKNPALRAGSTVPSDTPKKSTAGPAAKAPAKKQPAKGPVLEGQKWVVEFHDGNKEIVIAETEPRQVVYIYKCDGCVIQIKGKVNAITVDNCKKTGVAFDSAIATCEVVNCSSLQVQVVDNVPAIAIDNTSGCQVILGKNSLHTEIVTSKSCEMNCMIPDGDDVVEMPLPEQYKTLIKNKKLVTTCVEHV